MLNTMKLLESFIHFKKVDIQSSSLFFFDSFFCLFSLNGSDLQNFFCPKLSLFSITYFPGPDICKYSSSFFFGSTSGHSTPKSGVLKFDLLFNNISLLNNI